MFQYINRKRRWVWAFAVLVIAFQGCGKSDVPVGDAAENIRKLTLAYVQYAGAHQGVGPKDQATLATYMMEQDKYTQAEVDAFFTSPRDKQPYIIQWGQQPMGSGPIGPNPPTPSILVVERIGQNETRYVADGQVSIKELSNEACSQIIPASMK